jgi:hypothetical protein
MSAAPCSCEEAEALKARVRELEADRDWADGMRANAVEGLNRVTAERDALQAAIADTPENVEALACVLYQERFKADKGSAPAQWRRWLTPGASTILAHLRSRAAVTPGSGGGLGGGEVGGG